MNSKKIEAAVFHVLLIVSLLFVAGGAWAAESDYGRGAALLGIGAILLAMGMYHTRSDRVVELKQALLAARARSRFWLLPFVGLAVAFAGATLLNMSEGATTLEQVLSVIVVVVIYSDVKHRISAAPLQPESAT